MFKQLDLEEIISEYKVDVNETVKETLTGTQDNFQ